MYVEHSLIQVYRGRSSACKPCDGGEPDWNGYKI